MTMTKAELEAAIRTQCPPDILAEELARLNERYDAYLAIDDLCENRAIIGYGSHGGEKSSMYIGTPESFHQ